MHTLVLAAGGSIRLGRPKQLLRHRGSCLLSRSLTLANRLTPGHVRVVVGAYRNRCQLVVGRHGPLATTVFNRHWRRGMGTSLSAGLKALRATDAEAALILLCDQPHVTEADLLRLKNAWQGRPQQAAAAHYQDQLGVPAIIPRRHWCQFLGLTADRGAGPWLNTSRQVTQVTMPTAAFDVDTPEQLARL